jgi:hypothetical protein
MTYTRRWSPLGRVQPENPRRCKLRADSRCAGCLMPRRICDEGVVPTSVAAPMHPNTKGMKAFGQAVATAVSRSEH